MVNFLEVDKRVHTCLPRESQLKRCSLRDLLALFRTSWVLTTLVASSVAIQSNWSAGHVPGGQERL